MPFPKSAGHQEEVPAVGPCASLPPRVRRLAFQIARHGFVTVRQAARLLGWTPGTVQLQCAALRRLDLLTTLRPTWGAGSDVALALSRRVRIPKDSGGSERVHGRLGDIDELLAAVDLELELEAAGGRWCTWPEYLARLRRNPGQEPPHPPQCYRPAGVIEDGRGVQRPVWVYLRRRFPHVLRRELATARDGTDLARGSIYAPPHLCDKLERDLAPATVHPWEPPHLGGRAPLLARWSEGGAAGRQRGRAPVLSPTKRAVLRHLDRFGYATAAQIADATGARTDVRHVLPLLREGGFVQRYRARPPEPFAWSATAAGQAVIGSDRYPSPVQPRQRRHALALGDLARELTAATGGTWETEREIRRALLPLRRDQVAPPDGRVTLPDGRRVCVQLQLSRGPIRDQYVSAHRLRAQALCDEVWFVCVPDVAPEYRHNILSGQARVIRVLEWIPRDRSRHRPWYPTPRFGIRGLPVTPLPEP